MTLRASWSAASTGYIVNIVIVVRGRGNKEGGGNSLRFPPLTEKKRNRDPHGSRLVGGAAGSRVPWAVARGGVFRAVTALKAVAALKVRVVCRNERASRSLKYSTL